MTNVSAVGQFVRDLKHSKWSFLRRISAVYRAQAMLSELEKKPTVDSEMAQMFNARSRHEWVKDRAKSVVSGSLALDLGAGTAPFLNLFPRLSHETSHFSQYHA